MSNVAIVTARGGSKSITDKNLFPIRGQPLVAYPIQYAQEAKLISKVYVSTDCSRIQELSRSLGAEIIERPDELAGDHINHGDVIQHAVHEADKRIDSLENVVVLLGNGVMLDAELIDESLAILAGNPEFDSVMSVWEAADDHPLRAMRIEDGLVVQYSDRIDDVSTERQTYPKAFFYDQGVWTFRKQCVDRKGSVLPWWWMGDKCHPIVRNWLAGRDVHTHLDVAACEWWLENYPKIKEL